MANNSSTIHPWTMQPVVTTSTSIPYTTGAISVANYSNSTGVLTSTGNISANEVILDGIPLSKTLRDIQDRLAIITPDLEKLEKYSALKAAYEHYKMLEALIGDDNMSKGNK
jgi:hypothetical protein